MTQRVSLEHASDAPDAPDAPGSLPGPRVVLSDYDADGYDYRQFWRDRNYEDWAEACVVRRWLRPRGVSPWFVDLGAGFGRHLPHYRPYAERIVLVDYSWTNLMAAADQLARHPRLAEQVYLVRANLYHLPFRDAAFETALTARVLHHLTDLGAALEEMGRVIGGGWLLDVPSKHHLRARVHALRSGTWNSLQTHEPVEHGTASEPYRSYHVASVRAQLDALGWRSTAAASVANLRGWEQHCPPALRASMRPEVYGAELLAQRLGRTWWGPSQWFWLTRQIAAATDETASTSRSDRSPSRADTFASLLVCPRCRNGLQCTGDHATCDACGASFGRQGAIWDFAVR